MLRNEIYQGAIGGILDRRRGNADLDHTVMHARKLRLGGARLDVDVKASGRHMNAILPGCLLSASPWGDCTIPGRLCCNLGKLSCHVARKSTYLSTPLELGRRKP